MGGSLTLWTLNIEIFFWCKRMWFWFLLFFVDCLLKCGILDELKSIKALFWMKKSPKFAINSSENVLIMENQQTNLHRSHFFYSLHSSVSVGLFRFHIFITIVSLSHALQVMKWISVFLAKSSPVFLWHFFVVVVHHKRVVQLHRCWLFGFFFRWTAHCWGFATKLHRFEVAR